MGRKYYFHKFQSHGKTANGKKLVAGYRPPGTTSYPELVAPESALANKEDGKWIPFQPSRGKLPTEYVEQCHTKSVRDRLRRVVEENWECLKEPLTAKK